MLPPRIKEQREHVNCAGECAKAESTSDQAKEGDGKSQETRSGMSSSTAARTSTSHGIHSLNL